MKLTNLMWLLVFQVATTACLPNELDDKQIAERICRDTWKSKKVVVIGDDCLKLLINDGEDISEGTILCLTRFNCPNPADPCKLSACGAEGQCEEVDHPTLCKSDAGGQDADEDVLGETDGNDDTEVEDTKEDIEAGGDASTDEDSKGDADADADADTDTDTDIPDSIDVPDTATEDTVEDVLEDSLDTDDTEDTVDASEDVTVDADADAQDTNIEDGDTQLPDSEDVVQPPADATEDTVDEDVGETTDSSETFEDTDAGCKSPLECDDGNVCTKDECESSGQCTHTDLTITCDDGNSCTKDDICTAGKCAGKQVVCDDGNACTTDVCDSKMGCVSTVQDGGVCSDAKNCIENGKCVGGACSATSSTCDDKNACTKDACGETGCMHEPIQGCCTKDADCLVEEACLMPLCDLSKNTCTSKAKPDSASCDDGKACTVSDHCSGSGSCIGEGKNCDDGNVCTVDACDESQGCTHKPASVGSACDDGDSCTTGETCSAGSCNAGKPVVCDDGDECTSDSCNVKTGKCDFVAQSPCLISLFTGDFSCQGTGLADWTFIQNATQTKAQWNIDAIGGVTPPVSTCSLNFNGAGDSYCGTTSCDPSNSSSATAGVARINKSFDFSKSSSVKVSFQIRNDVLDAKEYTITAVHASTDSFYLSNPDKPDCMLASSSNATNWSKPVPKTKPSLWEKVVIDFPELVGKPDVKFQIRFVMCGWDKTPHKGPAIDDFKILATK